MESRDIIPFAILARRGPIDRGDGITVNVTDGFEATYAINGETVAVAYVDPEGEPRIDLTLQQRERLDDSTVRRLIAVLVMASVHANELSTLWHLGGPPHAG